MKTLGLISCTKSKQSYPCKAIDMYSTSKLFKKAFDYASDNYDYVAILSAKYGLLLPEDQIKPYNLTLNNMSSQNRKEWASTVFDQMKNRLILNELDKIFFHACKKYREHLIPKLIDIGIICEVPLGHLRIGEQLAWYKDRLL